MLRRQIWDPIKCKMEYEQSRVRQTIVMVRGEFVSLSSSKMLSIFRPKTNDLEFKVNNENATTLLDSYVEDQE